MPITPEEAFRITPEVEREAASFCQAVDQYLRENLSSAGSVTRIPLRSISPRLRYQKSRWSVADLYRKAGWTGAWFEDENFVLFHPRNIGTRAQSQLPTPRTS